MRLDMTITLGTVIQIAVMVTTAFLAYSKLRERLVAIDTKLGPLWDEYTDRRTKVRRAEDRAE